MAFSSEAGDQMGGSSAVTPWVDGKRVGSDPKRIVCFDLVGPARRDTVFGMQSIDGSDPTLRSLWAAAACAIALGSVGCDFAPTVRRPPDVVLLTIDTLRADHAARTYERATTAALDSHFAGAVTFDRAYSTSSWTAPALASLLTSLDPYDHGVRQGIAPMFLMGGLGVLKQQYLDPSLPRLPGLLRDAGYQTFGISANAHASEELGFAEGFDHFLFVEPEVIDADAGIVYTDAAAIRDRVLAWRASRDPERPSFLWVHLIDPHLPYRLREPWLSRYWPAELPSRNENLKWYAGLRPTTAPRAVRREALLALYDAEIEFASEQAAAILDEWGVDGETLLVFASDHGESFWEHERLGHAESLYESELRIPLRIRFPRSLGVDGAFRIPVSILDVMPTVLEVAGVAQPEGLAGQSLLRVVRDQASPDRILLAELARSGKSVHAAVQGRWKVIEDVQAGTVELYDLERDPDELRNLATVQPAVRDRLLSVLRARRTELQEAQLVELPESFHPMLEALGYVDLAEPDDHAEPAHEAARGEPRERERGEDAASAPGP